jgi:hypothetical protein
VRNAKEALHSLPWVDNASVKITFDRKNSTGEFRVPDMSKFREDDLLQALREKNVGNPRIANITAYKT